MAISFNVGGMDRTMRLILGGIFLIVGFSLSGWLQGVVFLLAAVGLVTGLVRFCPINMALKINSTRTKGRSFFQKEIATRPFS